MEKKDSLFQKYREIIMYLIFGVLTTIVGWAVYKGGFSLAAHIPGVSLSDKNSAGYIVCYIVIQVMQWIVAVLFAFFTNRRWVFTAADRSREAMGKQMGLFFKSRVATLLLDIVVTYLGILLLARGSADAVMFTIFGYTITVEMLSKIIASVLVVIANYVLSKLLVFRRKTSE